MVSERNSQGAGLVLHEIFEAHAAIWPDNVAVVFGSHTITYGELNAHANRLARHLRKCGLKRGASVAILLPRSIEAYAAILGILKSGAAYVPIDPMYPAERIAWIIEDSGACATVTDGNLATRFPALHGPIVRIDIDYAQIAEESPEALPPDDAGAHPEDLCYVIYTSGSTGRPKGVMVEHRNACHLVQAERGIFGVRREDRVYQGASLCFDLSVEEIWLAFGAGATLVSALPEMVHVGPDLSRLLQERDVTVLSCVPSLLSMLDGGGPGANLPTLRLLIVGGESCSKQLVNRWARPGLRIVNTYGPTETTVIATYADVSPDEPVTIGQPVPGYRIYLLDEQLRPVPLGGTGEICIAGAGVARGYRGLPDETAARFVRDPCEVHAGGRMYRSGDLGRIDRQGNLEFIGRADGQVKLRGLRVELGEIESALLRNNGVRAAACAVREDTVAGQQLVGYVVPRGEGPLNEEHLRSQLRNWLPPWMVPSRIETVGELPRLPSGKLDRASLLGLSRKAARQVRLAIPGSTTERKLMEVWSALFCSDRISTGDDFFLDLGGHSLLAARMVSELRTADNDAQFASLTVRDVYSYPTISRLAAALEARGVPHIDSPAAPRPWRESRRIRHFLAGVVQTASLYFIFGFRGLQWITPWLVYFLLVRRHSAGESMAWAVASSVAALPILTLFAISAKWTLLGRVRPGRYGLWGWFYLRWWFVQTLLQSLPLTRLGGTPLLPFVYRLFGIRIGKDVHIASDLFAAFDVISIDDGASIDEGASLLGYTVENGDIVIGPVSIGRGCLVGMRSVLCPDTVMEAGARLEDLSLLPGSARIPAGETWSGSPAQRRYAQVVQEPSPARNRIHRTAIPLLYAALVLAFPLIELSAFLPGVGILTRFNPGQALFYLAAPLAGACFIICVTAEVALLKWLLIGRARAGRYPVHGWFYIRNWLVEQLLAFSLDVAGPLHATIFLKPWYRALGAKLGRFVEFSTASTTTPDLLDIADDCTIADEASLGAARVERGWLTLAPTRLARRVFVGNGAVIPAGTTIGAGSLVGVLTVAPADRDEAAREGANWLGSPPILLTRRQPAAGFPEQTTFRPTRKLQWARGCWEFFRVTLPGAGFVVATVEVVQTTLRLWEKLGPLPALFLLPAIFAACCATVMLAVVPVKWIVTGRYRPFERPLWSTFIWRLELVNALFEFLATPIGLEALRGTPLLPWYLRLLGCRIGQGAYIDSTGFLEFDLVNIGDRAILNRDSTLQTHLFEDRVMKGSWLRIGSDCEIGEQSIVLYDTEMKDGARLGALSLLMKGETLPAGRVWVGSPLDGSAASQPAAEPAPDPAACVLVA